MPQISALCLAHRCNCGWLAAESSATTRHSGVPSPVMVTVQPGRASFTWSWSTSTRVRASAAGGRSAVTPTAIPSDAIFFIVSVTVVSSVHEPSSACHKLSSTLEGGAPGSPQLFPCPPPHPWLTSPEREDRLYRNHRHQLRRGLAQSGCRHGRTPAGHGGVSGVIVRRLQELNAARGIRTPVVCTPEELMEPDYET